MLIKNVFREKSVLILSQLLKDLSNFVKMRVSSLM